MEDEEKSKGYCANSKGYFQALAESMLDMITVFNREGKINYINPSAEKVMEYSPEEAMQINAFDFIHPEDLDRVLEVFSHVIEKPGKTFRLELRVRHKDGSYRTIEGVGRNLLDDLLIKGIVISSRDNTDQKKLQEALKESEERYRNLFENIGEGAALVNEEETFIFSNPAGEEIFGVGPGGLAGRSLKEFTDAENFGVIQAQTGLRKTGRKSTYELEIIRPDGERRFVNVIATPRFDEEEHFAGSFGVFTDITDRRRMENELKESEERYRVLSQSANDAIISCDGDGIIFSWNKGAADAFGYSESEVLGESIRLLMPEQKRESYAERLRRLTAHGEPPVVGRLTEVYGQRKDGSAFPLELSVASWEMGGEKYYTGIIRDITERKQAEEDRRKEAELAVRHQEALLEMAEMNKSELDPALRRICEIDANTLQVERVSLWSFNQDHTEIICEDLYRMSDGSHERGLRLMAENYPSYFTALEQSRTLAADDAEGDHRTREFTEDYLRPLGITSMMDVPVWLNGDVVGVVCHEHVGPKREWTLEEQEFAASVADMISVTLEASERKRAVEALEESEEHHRSLIENAFDLIVVVDLQGNVLYASPSVEHLLGYTPEEILGICAFELINYDDLLPIYKMFKERAGLKGFSENIEFRVRHRDGSWRYFESIGNNLLEHPTIRGIVVNARDVTDRKKLEEELDAFASTVAHDIRGALAVIGGFSHTALRAHEEGEESREVESLEHVIKAAKRTERYVEALLQYAQAGRPGGEITCVDTKAILVEVLDDLEEDIRIKGLKVVVGGEIPAILTDHVKLYQVFLNLIGNSIQHIGDDPEPEVVVEAEKKGREVTIYVRDNGPGIPPEKQEPIFRPFERAEETGAKGLGMGLAIVRRAVEAWGGKVWVEPTPGGGSTFCFTAPSAE